MKSNQNPLSEHRFPELKISLARSSPRRLPWIGGMVDDATEDARKRGNSVSLRYDLVMQHGFILLQLVHRLTSEHVCSANMEDPQMVRWQASIL